MNQAFLKTLARDLLDETCQRFIQTRGITPDISFYIVRSEKEIVCVSQIFPADTLAFSATKQIELTAEAIRRSLHDGTEPAKAVLTAGEGSPRSGRKVLLVTVDSPALTFLLFRYYELRMHGFDLDSPHEVVLLDTVDSSVTGQTEFLDNPNNAATHFFDGLRTREAGIAKEFQKQ